MRKLGWTALVLAVAMAAGCSSSSAKDEGGQPDVVADTGTDVPADVGADVGTDLATPEDVPVVTDPGTDTAVAETEEEASVFPDVPLSDVDFSALPTLPPGKTFTTRYAVGTARKLVNPEKSVHLGGYGFCAGDENLCRNSQGVHDDISASAFAIADTVEKRVVVFVGVDSSGMIRSDIDTCHHMLQNELAAAGMWFPGEQLLIGASHAHSAPDSVGIWGPSYGAGRQEWYATWLRSQIVAAAKEAVLALQDADLSWGQGTYENNDEDGFQHDKDMFVLLAKKAGGTETIGTLMRWPGHPTTYGADNLGVSADWVGTYRKKMEATVGGLAVFMQGPIGSVYPYRPDTCGLEQEDFPDGYHTPYVDKDHQGIKPADCMKVTCTGHAIAQAATDALATAKPLAQTGIQFHHTMFKFHPNNGSLMLLAQIGPLPFEWVDIADPESQMDSEMSWATIGDLNWLTTPGESFPSFAADARKILTDAGFTNPIVLGLTQDWMGYLLTPKQWEDVNLSYNQSLSPGPDVEPKFMAALQGLVDAAKAK